VGGCATPVATTGDTPLRVRHFDGTETDAAEWTHRKALARLEQSGVQKSRIYSF